MRRRVAPGDQAGSATLLVVGLIAVTLMLGIAALAIAEFAIARARASSAADLAALAGASHYLAADQCQAAERVAILANTRLAECRIEGEDVVVTVAVGAPRLVRRIANLASQSPPSIKVTAKAGQPGRKE